VFEFSHVRQPDPTSVLAEQPALQLAKINVMLFGVEENGEFVVIILKFGIENL
jgi:hypothetical protein